MRIKFSNKLWPAVLPVAAILILIWISYFQYSSNFDIVHRDDDGQIWVYDRGFERCLSFSPPPFVLRQGCIDLDHPNKLVFKHQQALLQEIAKYSSQESKILIIGLGAGTLFTALQLSLPDSAIDVVEINPTVPELASQYFGFSLRKQDKLYVMDGAKYIQDNVTLGQYDVIFVDAFDDTYVPSSFLTTSFVASVKRNLRQGGAVFINSFLNNPKNELEEELYSGLFSFINILTLDKNRVIIASSSRL